MREVIRVQRHRMVDTRALRCQGFQPAGGLTFPGLGFDTQHAGDCIKQATAGRGPRRVEATLDRRRQQRPVLALYRVGFRVLLPVRHKRQAVGEQIAPRLPRRQIAARQRNGRQATQMRVFEIADPQALSTPQRAVFPHADPVQRQGDNVSALARPAVFGQARRGVSVMVVYLFKGQRLRLRPLASAVSRMGIAHHARRLKGVNVLHHRQRGTPLRFHTLVTEIAKMLAQHRLVPTHQAEGVFHLRPGAQHGGDIVEPGRQRDGIRHKTARAAQHRTVPIHHRIVHPLQDIAVMQQEAVRDAAELIQRLPVGDGRRSAAEVAGGHHQRALTVHHQKVLQRVRRKHDAHGIQTGRDTFREGGQPGFWREHNGCGG